MTDRDLEMLAAVAQATAIATRALFETSWTKQIKQVVLEKREDYYALVDAWSESATCKNQARKFDSVFIGEYRCGARAQITNVLSLVIADAVTRNEPPSFYVQEALREGLHVFVTSMIALQYETFVSPTVTTPSTRRASAVDLLFTTAKEYLASTPRETLETILDSELNTLTLQRLSVAFAFINFLLDGDRERWTAFHKSLESAWSADTTPENNPERRKKALRLAVDEGLKSNLKDLDKQLQEFVTKRFLYLDDLAELLEINREVADSVWQGFRKVCELKRSQKPVSEKGERLFHDIQGRIDKKLQVSGQKF
jgi:predicted house-cleaning noncanonical NTP pyrophosphatase (MazG superfamily)